jgi:multisubunit Na+/H+ antiporter MnhG subunit
LEKEIDEKKKSLQMKTRSLKTIAVALFTATGAALTFLATVPLDRTEMEVVWLMIGITGPMSFAFPIVAFKNDYLRARMRKSPDWLVESVWGAYMTVCGLAFLLFAFSILQSQSLDVFTLTDILFILLISLVSAQMALRAISRRKRHEDFQSMKKEAKRLLDSKMNRVAYSAVIGAIVYVLPVVSLLLHPITLASLRGAIFFIPFAPLAVIAIVTFFVHQQLFIYVDQAERLKENVDREGAKCFNKNELAFNNLLRSGRTKGYHIRHSKARRDRAK